MRDVSRLARVKQFIHQKLQHRRSRLARSAGVDLLRDFRDCYPES
jgi:hypothetical protein